MKFGPFEIYYHPGETTVEQAVKRHLATDPGVARAIARMARSEVKNYLAELAEDAEVPFGDPVSFIRTVKAGTHT